MRERIPMRYGQEDEKRRINFGHMVETGCDIWGKRGCVSANSIIFGHMGETGCDIWGKTGCVSNSLTFDFFSSPPTTRSIAALKSVR